jgi:hypothetical protein
VGRNNHVRSHKHIPKGKKRGKRQWDWTRLVNDEQWQFIVIVAGFVVFCAGHSLG